MGGWWDVSVDSNRIVELATKIGGAGENTSSLAGQTQAACLNATNAGCEPAINSGLTSLGTGYGAALAAVSANFTQLSVEMVTAASNIAAGESANTSLEGKG